MRRMERREIWRRLAALHREMAELFESLARASGAGDRAGGEPPPPAVDPPPREEGADGDFERRAVACLESLGITVIGEPQRWPAEVGFERLARLIANKYDNVVELVRRIRHAQATRGTVRLDLRDQRQDVIADVTLLCDLAHKAGLLTDYCYRRTPYRRLSAVPSPTPLAIRFFGGGWLELHVRRTLLDLLEARGAAVDRGAVFGARVRLPDGDEFELDAFAVVGDTRIWIEAKSGHDFVPEKYARIRRRLCRPSDHALLLWADHRGDDAIAAVRGAVADMTLCGLADFGARLRAILACREEDGGGDARPGPR